MAFSCTSRFFVTTCSEMTKLWKINVQIAGIYAQIPAGDQPYNEKHSPISCINNEGTCVVVHRGQLVLTVYDIINNVVTQKEKIDLVREVKASGNPEFSHYISDRVTDLRFKSNQTELRVCLQKQKQHYFVDIKLSDSVATLQKARKYEDQSVFAS